MRRLGLWSMMVMLIFIALSTYRSAGTDPVDPWVVGGIGLTFALASLVMLAFTRHWTTRGVGILFTFLGCAVLYGGSWLFYTFPGTRQAAEPATDAVRSLLIVGGPLVLFGVALVIADWWRCRNDPECHDPESEGW